MAEGASGVQPPSSLVRIGLPPAAGGVVGPLRPACASCTPSLATPYCRQKSCTRLSAFSLSSDHMPAHFGEIRPCGLTSVISHITSPAQPSEKLPRCIRCQSFAEPLLELYWHIGETTTRLGSVSPRIVIGENRTLAINCHLCFSSFELATTSGLAVRRSRFYSFDGGSRQGHSTRR